MLDSIYVGMTGLLGYSKGLRVIANNTANLNTPGFKGSSLQFSDLFYSSSNLASDSGVGSYGGLGYGLNAGSTVLSFKQGEIRQTDNPLDMAIDGQGLFILRDAEGKITYTRAGQFKFNGDGVLVNQADNAKVMGRSADGQLAEISLAGLSTNAGKATANVKFNGNISSTLTEQTVGGVRVIDALGGAHTLGVKFTNTDAATPGSWKVELLDGAAVVATRQIIFFDGRPTAATAKLSMSYAPAGSTAMPLVLDFSTDVTSFAAGNLSTLAMFSQDGILPGALTQASFDTTGTLVLGYSNSQTVKGPRLALGRFDTLDAVGTVGDNQFSALDPDRWITGGAEEGGFGSIRSGSVEIANVDLSQEFSDLVVMQRGFQASSQVISTANEMLQQLFSLKGK
jgi:flagellar hook protein FlgE